MVDWLIKYWLEVAFTIVLGLITWGGRKLVKFYIKEVKMLLERTEKNILETIRIKDEEKDQKIDQLRAGLLSVQGRIFKEKCHVLLQNEHNITVEELEDITKDHEAYKGLGGNHEGDILFELVVQKAKSDIT